MYETDPDANAHHPALFPDFHRLDSEEEEDDEMQCMTIFLDCTLENNLVVFPVVVNVVPERRAVRVFGRTLFSWNVRREVVDQVPALEYVYDHLPDDARVIRMSKVTLGRSKHGEDKMGLMVVYAIPTPPAPSALIL